MADRAKKTLIQAPSASKETHMVPARDLNRLLDLTATQPRWVKLLEKAIWLAIGGTLKSLWERFDDSFRDKSISETELIVILVHLGFLIVCAALLWLISSSSKNESSVGEIRREVQRIIEDYPAVDIASATTTSARFNVINFSSSNDTSSSDPNDASRKQ